MKRIPVVAAVMMAVLLSACTTMRSTVSYVSPELTPLDAQLLAADSASHLSGALPAAKTTLVLDPPAGGDRLTPAMMTKLRDAGFGVVEAKNGDQQVQGVALRYLASPLENGVVLRLQYEGVEASRFYPRTASGALASASPFTVREPKQ
ncbi:hypothetical protein [Rhizobium sp. LCM 4573]|uniref:hypothetical protein n=1 Tax=Rhizobium sp. LCM 4573 TaxID=1848291 RepID=UPI0008DAD3CF|nr:hypothetical protein [Rhizobium sp. LCM 4573]OHV78536.1 hypothetical protein LCM4573_26535 [Rhizobium sp. LCM 4573]